MKRTIYILTVLLVSLSVRAQKEMLIGQLVNRSVVRENFDKNGVFLNKQTFKSGMLKELNGYYEIEVLTELFDENKKLNDTYTKAKETEINTNSKNFKELYDLDNLEDIELEMSFDSGLLDFFGSKSKIKIYDRIVEPNGNSRNIKSKINIKAYAIGIRFKQLDYVVNETLNDKGLLSSQKFTEKDGSYFTMTYK